MNFRRTVVATLLSLTFNAAALAQSSDQDEELLSEKAISATNDVLGPLDAVADGTKVTKPWGSSVTVVGAVATANDVRDKLDQSDYAGAATSFLGGLSDPAFMSLGAMRGAKYGPRGLLLGAGGGYLASKALQWYAEKSGNAALRVIRGNEIPDKQHTEISLDDLPSSDKPKNTIEQRVGPDLPLEGVPRFSNRGHDGFNDPPERNFDYGEISQECLDLYPEASFLDPEQKREFCDEIAMKDGCSNPNLYTDNHVMSFMNSNMKKRYEDYRQKTELFSNKINRCSGSNGISYVDCDNFDPAPLMQSIDFNRQMAEQLKQRAITKHCSG